MNSTLSAMFLYVIRVAIKNNFDQVPFNIVDKREYILKYFSTIVVLSFKIIHQMYEDYF